MRLLLSSAFTALLFTSCATTTETLSSSFAVTAAFETPVMASVGDSADDPAIYIGKDGMGFIAGTDKQAGLYIYNLDGTEREFIDMGMVNNVDLREGFSYKGEDYVLLVASDDETNAIVTLLYNPRSDSFMKPESYKIPSPTASPYGICLGVSPTGAFHAGVTTKSGVYQQHEISATSGQMRATLVREFSTGKQSEGCAFDDRTGKLYVAEEEGGFYQYPAFGQDAAQTIIAKRRAYGMKADLEGVTVYEAGADGGYAIVSSQGNNSYAVFRLPSLTFAGRFTIEDGAVDGVSTTDGIAVTSIPTARFPKGFLVVQDDMDESSPSEPLKKQNFKIIDWRDIEANLLAP